MPRFMGIHTLPKNTVTFDMSCQLAEAAQRDSTVRGYRSFINASEGKAVCIMEAENKQAVEAWFKKMSLPTDAVVEVELEGDRGHMHDLQHEAAAV